MAAILEIYLVRHAVAAERGPKYPDDRLRPLTPEGVKRFRESVKGLSKFGVELDLVLTSPLERARDTATLLAASLKPKPSVQELEALAPGGATPPSSTPLRRTPSAVAESHWSAMNPTSVSLPRDYWARAAASNSRRARSA